MDGQESTGQLPDEVAHPENPWRKLSNGTTAVEILGISTCTPISVLLVTLTAPLAHRWWQPATFTWQLWEWTCLVLPTLTCLTIGADHWHLILAFLIVLLLIVAKMAVRVVSSHCVLMDRSLNQFKAGYITNYRSSMLIVTAMCILAVDFGVFPRRFAKTENFGYGLMDIGVGSFIFAAGLLSPEARNVHSNSLESIKGSVPLVLLGLIRLVSVRLTHYPEQITEYGLHWNFFFTMAVTKGLSWLLFSFLLPIQFTWAAAILVAILYESSLAFGLADWILQLDVDPTRQDQNLLTANREGIMSSFGYLAIYLAGVSWGRQMLHAGDRNQKLKPLLTLTCWSLIMWGSLYYSQNEFFQPPSRRLANWSFFNWMVAYNLTMLALFNAVELALKHVMAFASKGKKPLKNAKVIITSGLDRLLTPLGFEAISMNSLFYFLLANLFTGLINLLLVTELVSACPAFLILLLYLVTLSTITSVLHDRGIVLKFW